MYFVVGEKTLFKYLKIIFSCCAILLSFANAGSAQATWAPRSTLIARHPPVAIGESQRALPASRTARQSLSASSDKSTEALALLLSQAVEPATVTLRDGKLTIAANNSNLIQILQDVSNISGMSIHGLDKGLHIFGVYGPGNARDVLIELLTGSDYNFIIVGGADGATPRALILSARNPNAPPVPNAPGITAVRPTTSLTAERGAEEQRELEEDPSVPDALGPGAIAPVPSLDDKDDATRTRINLERLQQMQDQQQQQQDAPPQ
ncbi:MAG TPA: hypothetical protein VMV57_06865 [Terracidiphilus sp.]|nr:hypothetical protein [Terracidiphilus sp.]